MKRQRLFLASRSPRRRELLEQIGLAPEVVAIDVDESVLADEAPADHVCRLALDKAHAGAHALIDAARSSASMPDKGPPQPWAWVVCADTVVVVSGAILGKPADAHEARSMLRRLSGRVHEVLTAVSITTLEAAEAGRGSAPNRVALSRSEVRFRVLGKQEIEAYIATGEPMDKAGGYAIQGLAGMFVQSLSGSYSGVVGLPLFETTSLLKAAGFRMPLD